MAMPYLAALHRWSGQAVQLAVLRQFDIVYLEQIGTPAMPAPRDGVGSRLPANCTALGKVLLAWENLEDLESFLPRPMPMMTTHSTTDVDDLVIELRKVRAEGVARELEESRPGLSAIAAPVVMHDFAVGAIAVTHAPDDELAPQLENALRDTAAQVARVCREDLARGKTHWFPHAL